MRHNHTQAVNLNNTNTILDRSKTVGATMVGGSGDFGASMGSTTSNSENDIHYPMPITVLFNPAKNQRYCSRFRFTCEFANTFDLVLQGEGTYEEHEHRPINPIPRQ